MLLENQNKSCQGLLERAKKKMSERETGCNNAAPNVNGLRPTT